MANRWDAVQRRCRLPRAPVLHEACAGIGTARLGLKAMGIATGQGVASDMKSSARTVLAEHYGQDSHVFGSMKATPWAPAIATSTAASAI